MKKPLQALIFILLLIALCAVVVHRFSGRETLSEYAQKQTGQADMAHHPAKSPSPAPTSRAVSSPQAENTAQPKFTSPTPEASPEPSAGILLTDRESADSVHYRDGFFYQPLTDAVKAKITGISYPVAESIAPALAVSATNIIKDEETGSLAVSFDELRYVNVLYYDFDGQVQTGELICNQSIAQDIVEIFYELFQNEYRIERIRLIDEYDGDDTASMEDNNTSCFNYRTVQGSQSLSKHALGLAIDINPFYNPYIVFDKTGSGNDYISPAGSEAYVDRSQNFPYKIDENDLCYKLFKAHGFVWGGNWNSCKDYQHFQKTP